MCQLFLGVLAVFMGVLWWKTLVYFIINVILVTRHCYHAAHILRVVIISFRTRSTSVVDLKQTLQLVKTKGGFWIKLNVS